MRRLVVIAACLALALAGTVALRGQAQAGGDYRVDVVFDNARGLIPGQLAQIAGARVGTIQDITLTKDFKARVKLKVSSRFAPFRTDAHCTIRPQGLIAENYVECDPGTPDAPPLRASGGEAPTVPVGSTTAPVAVTDLFDVWSAPVRDRVTVLLSQLGLSTAARGQDINEILRRANPSLALARRVIAILHRQRDQLATILDTTGRIAGGLAARSDRVKAFLDEAAATTSQTGSRAARLSETVHRLPGLLAVTEPALRDLDATVRSGTPLVRRLHQAAPALNRLSADIGPFARAAQPTITRLRPVLRQGTRSLQRAAPTSKLLRDYAHNSRPSAELAGPLFTNLRDRGFPESLLSFIYGAAAATGRFDAISHFLPAYITLSACAVAATTPAPGCSANYTKTQNTTRRAPRRRGASKPAAAPQQPGAAPQTTPATPAPAIGPTVKKVVTDPVGVVKDVVGKILHPTAPQSPRSDGDGLGGLLGYLLG